MDWRLAREDRAEQCSVAEPDLVRGTIETATIG